MPLAGPIPQLKARRVAAVLGLVLPILAPLAARFGSQKIAPRFSNPSPVAALSADHFSRHIEPVLRTRCQSCHGDEAPAGGLSLTARQPLLAGGDHGPAVVPGHPEESLLYQRISHAAHGTGRMPPGEAGLPAPVIERFAAWIRSGAAFTTPKTPLSSADRKRRDPRLHWAFRPLRQPSVPTVKNVSWVRTPVDRFVLAELERKQLTPAPRAARRQLIRRLFFDVLGLPPSVDEVEAFVQDRSHDAYPRLVDRVLASPHYGERWGRYWLDLARYADSAGYEADRDRPSAYPYRDWVIRALNDDLPYDEFVKRQIAGDLYTPGDARAAAATGFCTSAPTVEPGGSKKDRLDELDDLVSTTSTAFLGLTVGCARCHDHKFDPISQKDYYGLVSVFAGTRRTERALDTAAGALFTQQTAASRRRIAAARDEFDTWRESQGFTPTDFSNPARRRAMTAQQRLEWTRLEAAFQAATEKTPARPPSTLSLCGAGGTPTPVYAGGDPERPGPLVAPAVPALFRRSGGGSGIARIQVSPRAALAEWLVDPNRDAHRLTARVIVNRIWQHHFGQGLVRTPSDFGLQSDPPSHPDLLDYLATTFVTPGSTTPTLPHLHTSTPGMGWSLKGLHRLILTSAVYMQGTRWDAENARRDPENRLLWRRSPQRLDAEAIRDAMLSVSGCLNDQMYGPGIRPRIPAEAIFKSEAKYGELWPGNVVDGPSTWRRSIYIFIKRAQPLPMLQTFDAPEPVSACSQRTVTTVAPQALALLNDPFVRDQAQRLAARVQREAGSERAAQVDRLYRLALCRPPRPTEQEACLHFLTRGDASASAALTDLCQTVMGLNEFIYVD